MILFKLLLWLSQKILKLMDGEATNKPAKAALHKSTPQGTNEAVHGAAQVFNIKEASINHEEISSPIKSDLLKFC